MVDESEDSVGDEMVAGDEIEQAYQKALAALDDAEWEFGGIPPGGAPSPVEVVAERPAAPAEIEGPGTGDPGPGGTAEPFASDGDTSSASGSVPNDTPAPESAPRLAAGTDRDPVAAEDPHGRVTPEQIIEAALFVGGVPLTAKKLCGLLRGSFDSLFVERTIDELNTKYGAEGRPYEIRPGDGGYRLELRAEFDRLRQRVYGAGPREVKLSQDVLEVLALVAYRQPLTPAEIEALGKPSSGGILRQLLRRDLVAIRRGEGGRKDIRYHTTPRFLTVFGLASLDELPQPEDLARK